MASRELDIEQSTLFEQYMDSPVHKLDVQIYPIDSQNASVYVRDVYAELMRYPNSFERFSRLQELEDFILNVGRNPSEYWDIHFGDGDEPGNDILSHNRAQIIDQPTPPATTLRLPDPFHHEETNTVLSTCINIITEEFGNEIFQIKGRKHRSNIVASPIETPIFPA
ncbi:MAG TPA: hypothetical protein VMR41_00365 [Patescibacteria group bacterium]|nr:hypothetical protein [Patescibacteria group bacterium]